MKVTSVVPVFSRAWVALFVGAAISTIGWLPVDAQDTLPRPEPPFKGRIGRTAKDSVPDFPKEVQPPKGAPNILLILTDDVWASARRVRSGVQSLHQPLTVLHKRDCDIPTSTLPLSARPHVLPSLRVGIIILCRRV